MPLVVSETVVCFDVLICRDLAELWSTLHDGLTDAGVFLLHEIWR